MDTQAPPPALSSSDRRARMGERLRQLRRDRGMTLQEVAERSGLAVSTVSKVERGLMALTYDRFSELAAGLGADIAELFADGARFKAGEVAVARAGQHRLHETDTYLYEMLFPDIWGKSMTPMIGNLRPFEKMNFDRFISHSGEEFLFVLSGRVTVYLQDKVPFVLEAGDSIYLDSARGHLYASSGEEAARILVVCTNGADAESRLLAEG